MSFIPANISAETLHTLRSARDRLLQELLAAEAGHTRLPPDELGYLRVKLAGLENMIETYELQQKRS